MAVEPNPESQTANGSPVRHALVAIAVYWAATQLLSYVNARVMNWVLSPGAYREMITTPAHHVWWVLVTTAASVVVTVVALRLLQLDWREGARVGPSTATLREYAMVIGGTWGLTTLAWGLVKAAPFYAGSNVERNEAFVVAMSIGWYAINTLAGGLHAVGREVLFRGLAQRLFLLRWGRWPAILITATLSLLVLRVPITMALVAPMALFLGWVTEAFGSVRPAVVAHAAVAVAGSWETSTMIGVGATAACVAIIPLVLLRHRA
jgi:membrane protease YdiL (CAAX protease family)